MKRMIMAALMAVAAIATFAQEGEFYVTPRINSGYAFVTNNEGHGGILGGVGCNFEYMVTDNIGISAAVDFSYFKGEKFKKNTIVSNHFESIESNYSMGFINIPVLANYHFGSFAVSAGIQPGFLISPKSKYEVFVDEQTETFEFDTKDYFNQFQIGIPVGISYSFNVPITLGLSTTIPLRSLGNDELVKAQSEINDVEIKNSKIIPVLLTVGYRF